MRSIISLEKGVIKKPFDKVFWWEDNRFDFLISIIVSFLFVRFSDIMVDWINPKLEAGFNFTIPSTDDTIFYYLIVSGVVAMIGYALKEWWDGLSKNPFTGKDKIKGHRELLDWWWTSLPIIQIITIILILK